MCRRRKDTIPRNARTCVLLRSVSATLSPLYAALLYDQLAYQGRWINVDVVGPEDPDRIVYCWLNSADGRAEDLHREFAADQRAALREYLDGMSTLGRFLRFAADFRREEGYQLAYRLETIGDRRCAVLRLQDATEFLSKKDYTYNWQSEMHETFCFWSFADWRRAAEEAELRVLPASRAYTNPWLVDNRYRGKAELFALEDGALRPLDYPPTTMLLVTEKL
jgi:hypothetical protein